MPGPKMGPRPDDFDEVMVRKSPTFQKWEALAQGGKLKYACREFIKDRGDDEERLMRRIMIARRNNVKDHEVLKKARTRQQKERRDEVIQNCRGSSSFISSSSSSKDSSEISFHVDDDNNILNSLGDDGMLNVVEQQVSDECNVPVLPDAFECFDVDEFLDKKMNQEDVNKKLVDSNYNSFASGSSKGQSDDLCVMTGIDYDAVMSTRSFRKWSTLPFGSEFTYNQNFIKGQAGHEELLIRNIWRRMKYRRENRELIQQFKATSEIDLDESRDPFENIQEMDKESANSFNYQSVIQQPSLPINSYAFTSSCGDLQQTSGRNPSTGTHTMEKGWKSSIDGFSFLSRPFSTKSESLLPAQEANNIGSYTEVNKIKGWPPSSEVSSMLLGADSYLEAFERANGNGYREKAQTEFKASMSQLLNETDHSSIFEMTVLEI